MTDPTDLTDDALDAVHGGSQPEIGYADGPTLAVRLEVRRTLLGLRKKRQLIQNGARIAYQLGELEEFRDNVREVTGMGGA